MDYIGCKAKSNAWIYSIIDSMLARRFDGKKYTLIDGCAGSGSTSRFFTRMGFNVIANDLLEFSSVMVEGFVLSASKLSATQRHLQKINSLKGVKGFFYNHFSEHAGRLYFTDDNAQRIDACREYISSVRDSQIRHYLLYCGLEALSRVSNTTGVHAAFLKQFKARAKDKFKLRGEPSIDTPQAPVTHHMDIIELVKKLKEPNSVLYIDPPYNNRQFGPNYHLYETFVRYDDPELIGKTGLRKNWKVESGSAFCNKDGLAAALQQIVAHSQSELTYLSYSSDGIASIRDILNALNADATIFTRRMTRYKSDSAPNRAYNLAPLFELLFEVMRPNS